MDLGLSICCRGLDLSLRASCVTVKYTRPARRTPSLHCGLVPSWFKNSGDEVDSQPDFAIPIQRQGDEDHFGFRRDKDSRDSGYPEMTTGCSFNCDSTAGELRVVDSEEIKTIKTGVNEELVPEDCKFRWATFSV